MMNTGYLLSKRIRRLAIAFFSALLLAGLSLPFAASGASASVTTVVTGQLAQTTAYHFTGGVKQEGSYYYGLVNHNDSSGAFLSFDVWKSTDGGVTYAYDNTIAAVGDSNNIPSNSTFKAVKWFKSPATGMWNIWAKRQSTGGALKELAHLQSTTIDGSYSNYTSTQPYGHPSGDLGIFTDSPATTTYLISADTDNHYIYIYQLDSDCAAIASQTKALQWSDPSSSDGLDHREAPSMAKQNGYYYLFTSGQTGWLPNQQKYSYATSLTGTWSQLIKIGDATGYHSQLFSTAQVSGTQASSLIFSATRNAQVWGGTDNRMVWLPIYLNSATDLSTNYYDYTTIDYGTGLVTGHNYNIGKQLPIAGATTSVGTPANSYDGDTSSKWINDNQLSTATITYDLGSPQYVQAIKLMLDTADKRSHSLKVEVGDGTIFTTVYNDHTPMITWLQTLRLSSVVQGRYIRLTNMQMNSQGNNKFGIYEFQAWGGNTSPGTVVNETFDSQTAGSPPSGWSITAPTGTSVTVAADPSAADKSMKIADTSTSGGGQAIKSFTAQSGSSVTLQLDFKYDQLGQDDYIRLKSGSTVAINIVNSSQLNALSLRRADGSDLLLSNITAGTWYTLRLEINTDAGTFDAYLNDSLVRGGAPFTASALYLDKLSLGAPNTKTNTGYVNNITLQGPN